MRTKRQEEETGANNSDETDLQIALPEPSLQLEQDEEWIVVKVDGEWRQIRLHEYRELYRVPGLYDKVIYDVLDCQSPNVVRRLLQEELQRDGENPEELTVLDLGAGSGIVGEELEEMHVKEVVGVDILPEAQEAAWRERPDVYCDYVVGDITKLSPENKRVLDNYDFNCLTCVAALGFGDIPPPAFSAALDRVETDGWVAFNIKSDFLNGDDPSGFADFIRDAGHDGSLEILREREYPHRCSTTGGPILYSALVARKH
ncbi:MAG: methyltransferase domain-containing protein [Armatimonadetes bacterium]|nr:methyltransferase domain-containing protein [Armatimonadota bacterium]